MTPAISVILTTHREGVLAGPTIRSLEAASAAAVAAGVPGVEVVAVLDRPDPDTVALVTTALPSARHLTLDAGDPGLARNLGIAEARGTCVAMLDGDDLWSENWLLEAWRLVETRPEAIGHSEMNLTFGAERNLWWHVDSEGPLFDPDYLDWANYWDAMSFGRREIYLRHPYRANDLALGVGHEDWSWNLDTLAGGHPHKPVPDTIHFKRRRMGSQIHKANLADSVPWPKAGRRTPEERAARARANLLPAEE
jgi:glycosyltransferase involved in cell wall biosynthesis